eukprot:ANDGO_07834.mRNA.1 Sphingoid long chain base kinase 4
MTADSAHGHGLTRLAFCVHKSKLCELAVNDHDLYVTPVVAPKAGSLDLQAVSVKYDRALVIPIRLLYSVSVDSIDAGLMYNDNQSPPFHRIVEDPRSAISKFIAGLRVDHYSYTVVKGTHPSVTAFKVKTEGTAPLFLKLASLECAFRTCFYLRACVSASTVVGGPPVICSDHSAAPQVGDVTSAHRDSRQRKTLVLINPFSGKKKSQMLFMKHVKPVLDRAGTPYDVVLTQHPLHAMQIAFSVNVDEFECVATCSGDGLMHEVVNGLLRRPDWIDIRDRIAVCPIPCGTSNALAASFSMIHPADAAAALSRRTAEKCDLFFFETLTTPSAVSSTEPLPSATEGSSASAQLEATGQHAASLDVFQDYSTSRWGFLSVAWGFIADCDLGTEDIRWMGSLRNQVGALKFIKKKKRPHAKIRYVLGSAKNDGHAEESASPVSAEDWVDMEDDFFMILFSNLHYLSWDVMFSPLSKANDGLIELLLVRDCKRLDLLKLFGEVERGNHIGRPEVECTSIRSAEISFDPESADTFVAVDGEKLPLQPFRVSMDRNGRREYVLIRGLDVQLPSSKL